MAARPPFTGHLRRTGRLWRFYSSPEDTEDAARGRLPERRSRGSSRRRKRFASADALTDFCSRRGAERATSRRCPSRCASRLPTRSCSRDRTFATGDYVLDYVRLNMQAVA